MVRSSKLLERAYVALLRVLAKLGVRTGENASNRDEGIH